MDIKSEIWRDIEGYEGSYQVSNLGNVRSLDRKSRNRWGEYIIPGKTLRPGKHRNGYLGVALCAKTTAKTVKVHRLVAGAFCDNPNDYTEVHHIDHDTSNNCADNLEWVSRTENMHAARDAGKLVSKLTPSQVRRIRTIYSQGVNNATICRMYGINHATVSSLVNYKHWKHV